MQSLGLPPVAQKSSVFEDLIPHTGLFHNVLEMREQYSMSSCARACNYRPLCRSFTFCSSLRCYLNSEDIYSSGGDTSLMQDSSYCNYLGMLRNHAPECIEGPIAKDIKDDEDPGTCKFNKKRVDQVLGPWELMSPIHTTNEWRVYDTRKQLVAGAHGGKTSPDGVVKNHEWLLRSDLGRMNWTEGKDFCEKLGGAMFYNLDGTKEQLDFVYDTFGDDTYWIGVSAVGGVNRGQWETVRGMAISSDKLLWKSGDYPKNDTDFTHVMLTYSQKSNRRDYLKNNLPSYNRFVVCDMIV